ncbi:acyl-CoA dehydrogenase family protein [Dactylosporangium sp. CA-092794]|uniref:acyl-CoA dehydrogenase family protein n=1 Tax=Dactylosporangium sp. CA-092794 TaxID=3239929 RepID=UPI003D8E3365
MTIAEVAASTGSVGDQRELQDRLLRQVDAVADVIAAGTEYANRERQLAPEVVQALADAHLFSMLAPARHGGLGANAQTASAVVEAVARRCGSAAWVTMITNGGNFYASRFPQQAQEDVYGPNPGARLASVTSLASTFTETEGGYIVNGRWPFSSGIMHDDWAVLGNAEFQAILPIGDVTIEKTWETVGLRGTGSHTTVVEDVFVPSHRVATFKKVMGYDACTDPGLPAELRLPIVETSALLLGSVIVGIGQHGCQLVSELGRKRPIMMTPYEKAADSQAFQASLGECIMRVESGRLHLAEVARTLDAAAAKAEMLSDEQLVRTRAGVAHGTRLVTLAIDELMNLAGSSSYATASPLAQVWRDAHTGASHAVLSARVNYEWVGLAAVNPDFQVFKP